MHHLTTRDWGWRLPEHHEYTLLFNRLAVKLPCMNGSPAALALGRCLQLTRETSLAHALRAHAVKIIRRSLAQADGNATHAASALGVSLRTLNEWRAANPELDRS